MAGVGMPPVPGVHHRTCRGCGLLATITPETSVCVKRDDLIEIREYTCGGCARVNRITVPSWRDGGTEADVGRMGEWFARRRRDAVRRADAKRARDDPDADG